MERVQLSRVGTAFWGGAAKPLAEARDAHYICAKSGDNAGQGVEGTGALATIYDLKPKFQALLRPLCARLVRAGVTANGVTFAALLLSVAYGAAIYATHANSALLIGLPAFLFLRMAMNAIDGMLAREFGQKSDFGALFNEISDVTADAALYLPFAVIAGLSPALVVLVVVIGVVAETTGIAASMIGASRRYEGPFGKSDRAFFFGALGLLVGLGVAPGLWSTILLAAGVFTGVVTIINRVRAALKEANDG
jgi:CDP-diacylglycerol--glycerol-3-phosphate 3-phosphatidyltransferase